MSNPDNPNIEGESQPDVWPIADDVTYLNHGSFGPSPRVVDQVRHKWTEQLERQPMDFFLRQMEEALAVARESLAAFVGADADDLIFVDNATYGMNIVAASIELQAGDEVLVTDHEYGAVLRIWRRACKQAAAQLVVRKLGRPFVSADETAADFLKGVNDKTKLIVVSHVTSPTALTLPVQQICRGARQRGVPVCVDGPHAIAMTPLNIRKLDCDYYAASCHKWLSAPFGTGFLYVARRRQAALKPPILSWGGSINGKASDWKDEFNWVGTRDPAGFLAVPAAIEFLESAGFDQFRESTHQLAKYARLQIDELFGMGDIPAPDSSDWYASMIALPISAGNGEQPREGHRDPLQDALWEQFRIEVPIVHWQQRRFVRVSCHLYNSRTDIDQLTDALRALIG
jgi:isopenicillin-N epimerase